MNFIKEEKRNVFTDFLNDRLPEIFSLFNFDGNSEYFSVGDRLFWGWKTIDFANSSFQSVINGMSLLLKHGFFEKKYENFILLFIKNVFKHTKTLIRENGSLDEAYPYENSYCATTLTAANLCATLKNSEKFLSDEEYDYFLNEILKPLINYSFYAKETHGFISNHLLAAALAFFRYYKLTGELEYKKKGEDILNSVLDKFDDEGWFLEYDGADPGYQTLAFEYLTEINEIMPEYELKYFIEKSSEFLSYFIFPNGSFGGIIGARQTSTFYPGGFAIYRSPLNDSILYFMKKAIKNFETINLKSIDYWNLHAMFNSYAKAAVYYKETEKTETLPFEKENFVKIFDGAGFFIKNSKNYYLVIALKKGGIFKIYDKNEKTLNMNSGNLIKYKEKLYSNAGFNKKATYKFENDKLVVINHFYAANNKKVTPKEFAIFRLLNVTIMRFSFVNEIIKKIIVFLLISKKEKLNLKNKRVFKLKEKFEFYDKILEKSDINYEKIKCSPYFKHIHMASSGYFEKSDIKIYEKTYSET